VPQARTSVTKVDAESAVLSASAARATHKRRGRAGELREQPPGEGGLSVRRPGQPSVRGHHAVSAQDIAPLGACTTLGLRSSVDCGADADQTIVGPRVAEPHGWSRPRPADAGPADWPVPSDCSARASQRVREPAERWQSRRPGRARPSRCRRCSRTRCRSHMC